MNNRIYDSDRVFIPKPIDISKWTRFKLLFAKKYIGTDTEGDVTSVTEMKRLGDDVYVTHTWLYLNGKLIREDKL